MKYIEQFCDDLVFFVFAGHLPTDQFTIYQQRDYDLGFGGKAITANVGIIGESHFCLISLDGAPVVSEVFACTEITERHCQPTYRKRLSEIDGEFNSSHAGLDHRFSAEKRPYHELGGWMNRFRNHSHHWLEHRFSCGDGSEEALTCVALENREREIGIRSIHTYPNQSLIVITNSVVSRNNQTV